MTILVSKIVLRFNDEISCLCQSFSLERYLAICTPLYIFPLTDIRRACLVSLVCWATALLASVPHLLFTKINYIHHPDSYQQILPQSAFCAMMDDNIYPEVTRAGQYQGYRS